MLAECWVITLAALQKAAATANTTVRIISAALPLAASPGPESTPPQKPRPGGPQPGQAAGPLTCGTRLITLTQTATALDGHRRSKQLSAILEMRRRSLAVV